jgi:predicted AAA+ superfamily ATPase
MVDRDMLALVAREQAAEPMPPDFIAREREGALAKAPRSLAAVVKGIRRCGKSTLLRSAVRGTPHLAFNFDDERLAGFAASDFQPLMETLIALKGDLKTVCFDEIQNVRGWELFANRLLRAGYRVFLTGSNADLLSRELGTRMTGRHYDFELWPFSFCEYLLYRKIPAPKNAPTTAEAAALQKAFSAYLRTGGMPEAVRAGGTHVLPAIVEDALQKDIIRRYAIRKPAELCSILKSVIANASSRFTYRSLANNFGIKNHVTVQKYLSYASDAYLIFAVERYEPKLKLLAKSPKKAYCADTGIVAAFSPLAEQRGALLENAVALELKRRGESFFYYANRDGSETDFVVVGRGGRRITKAMQVCYDARQPGTREREESALCATLEETGAAEGIVLTFSHQETREADGMMVRYLPAWKWLLGLG